MPLRPKNWQKFQHFKDRRPPWIKLYRDILDNPDWHDLSGDDAKALVMLWLIASEDGGVLPDVRRLAFRLRMQASDVEQLLSRLGEWLDRDDISSISSRYQLDAPETETETEKKEEDTAVAVQSKKSSTGSYFFESGKIRLSEKDFKKWEQAFSHLDLRAELVGLTQWASQQPQWFFAVSGALAKRNRELGLRERATGKDWKLMSGREGVL